MLSWLDQALLCEAQAQLNHERLIAALFRPRPADDDGLIRYEESRPLFPVVRCREPGCVNRVEGPDDNPDWCELYCCEHRPI